MEMDSRAKKIIAIGAAAAGAAGAAVAGAAAYLNQEELFALGIRKTFKKNDDKRDAGLTAPEDVTRVTDLAYGTDPEQELDIYYPAGTTEPLPTIVSVHGGAQLRHVRAGPGQGDDAHQVLFGLREGRPLGKDGRAGKHHGRLPAVLCHDGDGGFPEAQRGAYGTAADAAGRGKRGARVRRGGRRGAGTCVPLRRAQPLRTEVQRG